MRRLLGGLVAIALLVPALTALAEEQSVRDDFKEISYSGNDGSLDWAGPWVESGEKDGPASGQITVDDENCPSNRCLHMEGVLLASLTIRREADLSSFTTADLGFEMRTAVPLASEGTLTVQARGNGSGWETLATYPIISTGEHLETFDVTSYAGADFELRFILTTVLDLLGGPNVHIDRVVIEGPVPDPTTTTTSSSSSSTSSTSTTSTTSATSATSATPPTDGTTTTSPEPSTTTADGVATTSTIGAAGTPPLPPSDGELRDAGIGLLADYRPGMMGDLEMGDIEVLGAEVTADFSMVVEVFEAAKLWIAVLALLIGVAIVSGMDRRRHDEREKMSEQKQAR